jgi:hypothetical protein
MFVLPLLAFCLESVVSFAHTANKVNTLHDTWMHKISSTNIWEYRHAILKHMSDFLEPRTSLDCCAKQAHAATPIQLRRTVA